MAEQKGINASFDCMGYGFEVKLMINGVDLGLKGGESESKRLFNIDHPMVNQATPDIRAQLFILKAGENKISLKYKKVGQPSDKLTFQFFVGDDMNAKLSLSTEKNDGVWEEKIIL